MFACLYLPPRADSLRVPEEGRPRTPARGDARLATLLQVARDFSPRVETHGDCAVTLDISGLGRLIGDPRSIGNELRRTSADAGLGVHIAVASTSTAAILLAHARAGLTVVAAGDEARTLAPLPIDVLDQLRLTSICPATTSGTPGISVAHELKRWGLRTLGDVGALPSGDLSARLGQAGLRWQRWARGEEMRPLVPAAVAEQFEESLDLEWPVDGLEPLSFVLARLLEPLCERLERSDCGAVILRVTLTLVTRERHERVVELPAPMRDARVLRTLALLDLESNPPPAAIDRVAVEVDATEGRVLQFGLFARALPTDKLATLLARLGALMGSDRVGAPALVDTYRPGAFTMTKFDPPRTPSPDTRIPSAPLSVLRRFRSPIPARVTVEQGRPIRVTTDRRGVAGGRVERCEGPWRSSGDWWRPSSIVHRAASLVDLHPWNCDEWDVSLTDGTTYRISQAHNEGAWFVEGMVD